MAKPSPSGSLLVLEGTLYCVMLDDESSPFVYWSKKNGGNWRRIRLDPEDLAWIREEQKEVRDA